MPVVDLSAAARRTSARRRCGAWRRGGAAAVRPRARAAAAARRCCGSAPTSTCCCSSCTTSSPTAGRMGMLVPRAGRALRAPSRAGRPSPLPELPMQYADYAVWQRERLDGRRAGARSSSTGGEQLAGAPPLLELPTDRPRPPVQSFRGATAAVGAPGRSCRRRCATLGRARGGDAVHGAARRVPGAALPLHRAGATSSSARRRRARRGRRPRG